MEISKLAVKNFKRFEDLTIDIGPRINVLLGPNSSGKSSIIKALLALKQTASVANENELLSTQGDYVDLGVYKDYVHAHEISRKIVFGIETKNTKVETNTFEPDGFNLYVEIIFAHDSITEQVRLMGISISESRSSEKSLIAITKKLTRESFVLKLSEEFSQKLIGRFRFGEDEGSKNLVSATLSKWDAGLSLTIDDRYDFVSTEINQENDFQKANTFITLYPIRYAKQVIDMVFKSLDKDIFYIGPLRKSPSRSYARTGHLISVGSSGEYTPSILANLKSRAARERKQTIHKDRLKQLTKWIDDIFPKLSVDTKTLEDLVKLIVVRGDGSGETISDVGFGISQILPILVQAAVMPDGSTLMIEQPELHLHPSAQTKFAKFMAEASHSGRRFIIETHSEHIVRGLQLAVSNHRAEKAYGLESSQLCFHYIPGVPEAPHIMEIDEWGEFIEEWPSGFFDEGYRMTMRLLENKMGISSTSAESKKIDSASRKGVK